MQLTALAWNLFHGRDFPPDPALFTWRSRLLRRTERNATHVQVNRELLEEFTALLVGAEWDVALLQECPPRWCEPLARACGAAAHRVLTARNSLGALRAAAARLNPDLVASAEGGSNLTLIRPFCPQFSTVWVENCGQNGLGEIVERRKLEIHTGRPERRAMAFTRIAAAGGELCVANLHATNDDPGLAGGDVLRAATAASEWAGRSPLLFGGDLNLRPAESPRVFEALRESFGLAAATGPEAIDHLLTRNLEIVAAPEPWPPWRRELREDDLSLRLSDHTPIEATFATGNRRE